MSIGGRDRMDDPYPSDLEQGARHEARRRDEREVMEHVLDEVDEELELEQEEPDRC